LIKLSTQPRRGSMWSRLRRTTGREESSPWLVLELATLALSDASCQRFDRGGFTSAGQSCVSRVYLRNSLAGLAWRAKAPIRPPSVRSVAHAQGWLSVTRASERYIPMLLWRVLVALGFEHFECLD
jgi:hypothetical protein